MANYWDDNLAAYAIKERTGWESERGTGRVFVGIMVLSVPQGDVEDLRSSFQSSLTSYWPGLVGGVAAGVSGDPVIDTYEMEREHPGRPGFSRITLFYRKAPLLAQMDTALKCILYVDISGVATRMTRKDVRTDAQIEAELDPIWQGVEGPHPNPQNGDDFLTEYFIVSGSNEIMARQLSIRLTVAYTTVPFTTLYNTVGKYHTGEATFGGAFTDPIVAKKLLYIGSKIATDTNRHGKWLADHFFLTSDVAYDVEVVTQAKIKRALEVAMKRMGAGGFEAAPGQKSRIIVWEPTGAEVTVDVRRGSANFAATNGILAGLDYLNVG